jgi:hypothetical protein
VIAFSVVVAGFFLIFQKNSRVAFLIRLIWLTWCTCPWKGEEGMEERGQFESFVFFFPEMFVLVGM